MSYLKQPQIFFSGSFRADPSTVNNYPDNYNPNNLFPLDKGFQAGNQAYTSWNPNGTGEFALDCTITKIIDHNGVEQPDDPLLGLPLVSTCRGSVKGAKIVDLDPQQQGVSELWGMTVQIGDDEQPHLLGDYLASAFSNMWRQALGPRGDFAFSAVYQSVLQNLRIDGLTPTSCLNDLLQTVTDDNPQLSISFVVRAYNRNSINYLINDTTLAYMNILGVPSIITAKLTPLGQYQQGSGATPGLIPTESYFTKLLKSVLKLPDNQQYFAQIKQASIQTYAPNTEFDFTHGQVFGAIGLALPEAPTMMTADRMLAPTSDASYFAPLVVDNERGQIIVNLGNSLQSVRPASADNSHVDIKSLGKLQLCYFNGDISVENAQMLGEIDYQTNDFYIKNAGLAIIKLDNDDDLTAINSCPLGIISTNNDGQSIILNENAQGSYLRPNQFVYRMNPEQKTTDEFPRGNTQQVDIYATQFGQPLKNTMIKLHMKAPRQAANANGTNLSIPQSALTYPKEVQTNKYGIASFPIKASNPGNPRGYIDGQLYFLNYNFADSNLSDDYVQPDDATIDVHIYTEQPDIADVTWENFVAETLGQYGELYPIMNFINLDNELAVAKNACEIYTAMNRPFTDGDLMPVTRDMSASNLKLLNRWLLVKIAENEKVSGKKCAFATTSATAP